MMTWSSLCLPNPYISRRPRRWPPDDEEESQASEWEEPKKGEWKQTEEKWEPWKNESAEDAGWQGWLAGDAWKPQQRNQDRKGRSRWKVDKQR